MSSSVQLLSCVQLFVTPYTAAHQPSWSITNSWSLLKPMSFESVMPSNHLILCCPLLLLLSISPSIRVFSNKSAIHIMWPEYWSFSFSISPFSEYSELISFRMDWCDGSGLSTTSQDASDSGSGQVGIWPLSSSTETCWIWAWEYDLSFFRYLDWNM